MELFSGSLKLRYSSTPFSKKFPSWPVSPSPGCIPVVGPGPGLSFHFRTVILMLSVQRSAFASQVNVPLSGANKVLGKVFQRLNDGKG